MIETNSIGTLVGKPAEPITANFQQRITGWLGLPEIAARSFHERFPAIIIASVILSGFISFANITTQILLPLVSLSLGGVCSIFFFARER